MKRSRAAIGTAALTTAVTSLALLGAGPVSAAGTVSEPLVTGLQGAFQLDVSEGRMLVGQNYMGKSPKGELTWIGDDGSVEGLWEKSGTEVAAAIGTGDTIAFLTTTLDHDNPGAALMLRDEAGVVTKVADLHKFEKQKNPDGDVRYGARVGDNCAAKLPKMVRPYSGIVESHPYAIANAPDGGWYVADAAGNSILKVNANGGVRTVDVLKPALVKITAAVAKAFKLDECAVGHMAAFEPVPTDVEVARTGNLVVSSLAGGPEHPALGNKGSVRRIKPDSGKERIIARGLVSAVNVAISKAGDIYVADLFGGQVRKIVGKGRTELVVGKLNSPASIEWFEGKLYASVGLFDQENGGSIVTITPESVSD